MHTPGCVVFKNLLVVGAFALVSLLPVSAQRIRADAVKNGHFPQALGHLDARPDKSIHHLPSTSNQAGPRSGATAAARPANPPRPIVSPYLVPSSRSGSVNYGFLVGDNPFSGGGNKSSSVKTFIVPIVFKVHQVATDFSVDPSGFLIMAGIKNQDATFDPTQAAPACLGNKNNVPFTLAVQSPIFQNTHWNWGGTDLGNAQYIDAFQRANYWNAGEDPGDYHLHLNTQTLPPVVIDFPAGTAIGLPQTSSFLSYSECAPTVLVDFNLFDEYLDYVVIPQLASSYGVSSGNFTMFIAGNALWGAVIGQLPYFEAQAAGYHSFGSIDPAQTYGVTQFGDEAFWTWPDAVPLSHEVAEWANDPTVTNDVQLYNTNAAFDPTGPVACQGNYETGDVLSGFFMPPVKGRNGYTYTLQELPFFSYFYGGPSIGVNGWYSNNNTLTTDAGPACSPF